MRTMAWMLGVGCVVGMLVGCGDDTGTGGSGGAGGSGGSAPSADVNEATARQSATTTITNSTTAIAGDGLAASQGLAGLGPSLLGIVQPAGAGAQSLGETGSAKQAVQTGVCDCTGTSCTFEGCGDDAWGSDLTIDGTLSWADGNVLSDLTYTGTSADGASSTYTFTVAMNVTVGAGTIDGTVNSTGEVVSSGATTSWAVDLTFNDVTFDDAGCALSGSMDVTATTKYVIQESTGTATITFDGSGC